MSEYDHPRFGIPNQSPFDVQWSKPSPVLTQKEQRALATLERNRASARKRSAEILAAKKATRRSLDCLGRPVVDLAPRSKSSITITTKQAEVDRSARLKKGASI